MKPELDKETTDALDAAFDEGQSVIKTAMIAFCEGNVPKEYHVSMLNSLTCELMASALDATTKGLNNNPEETGVANDLLDMFCDGVMPLFAELARRTNRGGVLAVGKRTKDGGVEFFPPEGSNTKH